jgi:hypothetical protein
VFELEPCAQQRTRIVRNAPQPGLIGKTLLALRRCFASYDRLARERALRPCEGLLHACALCRIGALLRLGIGRTLRLRRAGRLTRLLLLRLLLLRLLLSALAGVLVLRMPLRRRLLCVCRLLPFLLRLRT